MCATREKEVSNFWNSVEVVSIVKSAQQLLHESLKRKGISLEELEMITFLRTPTNEVRKRRVFSLLSKTHLL